MRFSRSGSTDVVDMDSEDASAFAETVKDVVGRRHRVSLMAMVQLEVRTDRPENRILALTDHQVYVLFPRVPAKLEHTVSFLDLHAMESRNTQQMVLSTETKRLVFTAVQGDSAVYTHAITHIGTCLATIFPSVPLDKIVHKISVSPSDRLNMMHERVKAIQKKELGPCGGFSVAYRSMCEYHGLPYMEDVAWDVDTIYLSHDTRELNLGDFDHLDSRHWIPIISAIEHNTWFTKFNARNVKLSPEASNELLKVMRKNTTIEELLLSNIGAKWEFANRLAQALMSNANSPLAKLDLSCNLIEDRGINNLCGPISQLSRGLVYLNLAKTGVTAKGVNKLSEALSANKFIASTLKHLDLSDNVFKGEDIANLYNFLAHPNAISTLKLSGNDCALEMIFGALQRGCSQSLTHLDLSRNVYTHRRIRDVQVPNSWQRFFAGSMALQYVNLSECKVPPEAIKHVLLGIGANPNIRDLEVNLSSNNLGSAGTDFIDACFSNLHHVTALDISDNGLDMVVPLVVEQIMKNPGLKKLSLGKNFANVKPRHLPAVLEAVVKMIQDEDSTLESLSLADSKLKLETAQLINSLGGNTSLVEIDVSGNQMGDTGARMLAKALQINSKLRSVLWDRNCTTPQGFVDIAAAMKKNYALKTMPTPVHDASVALRLEPEKTAKALERIEALLQRNHSPRKFASEQGYRLQHGFLVSSTQQMVDKMVVQVQDIIKELEKGGPNQAAKDDINKANIVVKEADRSTQMLPKLQEVALKSEETGNQIERKIHLLSMDLQFVLDAQLRANVKNMLRCVEDQCPTVLGEKDLKEDMKAACTEKGALPKSFSESLLQDQVGTDVFNKISELNLAVASHMTDKLIDGVLESLERTYRALARDLREQGRGSRDSGIEEPKQSLVRKKESLPPESPGPLPKISNKRESQYCRRLRPQSVIDPADVEKARKMAQQEKLKEAQSEASSPEISKESKLTPSPLARETKTAATSSGSRRSSKKSAAPPAPVAAAPAPVAAPRDRDTGGDGMPVPAPRLSRIKRHSQESLKSLESETGEDPSSSQKLKKEEGSAKSEKLVQTPEEEEEGDEEEGKDEDEDEGEDDSRSRDSKDGTGKEKDGEDSRSIDTIDSISTVDSSLDSREGTPISDVASSKSKGAKYKKQASTSLDLPSLQLDSDAPKLEHLGKARPKRAKTRAAGRPVIKSEEILIEDAEVGEGMDDFFEAKAVSKEVTTPGDPPSEKEMNQANSSDEKLKEDSGSKKKGWSPFGSDKHAKGLASGITNFFGRKSPKSPESAKKIESDRKTPPSRKSPEIELDKEDSGGFKSEEDKDEPEEEIKPTPRKPRGVGLPGMGMGGGGALIAEMKAKRETKMAPMPTKKSEDDKDVPPKEGTPAPPGSKPPPPKLTPTGGAKLPVPGGAALRPTSVLTPREASTPAAKQRASSPALVDDGSSNGPKTKPLPLRPKPPPVAPKPSRASAAPTPVARQSTVPPRPSDVPDDKSKSPATETGMDARTDSIVRKRYSVKQKAALLDKNSNETPSGEGSKTLPKEKTPEKDLPQRSLSAGSSSSKKISEDDKKASDTKDKADGDSQSSKDMQLNGSTKSTETKEIYL